jgi:hypothetical protein
VAQGGVLEPGARGGLVVGDAGDVQSNSMQNDEEPIFGELIELLPISHAHDSS